MEKENIELSRRRFIKSLGLAGAAAGVAGIAGGIGATRAEAAPAEQVSVYESVMKESGRIYVKKAACPGPSGPVAFESRLINDNEIVGSESADLVIIGAGLTGLVAALKAAEEGAKVIILEKMTKGRACFECFGAINARVQKHPNPAGRKELPLVDFNEFAPKLFLDIMNSADWRIKPDAPRTYIERSGEATDFLETMLQKGDLGLYFYNVSPGEVGISSDKFDPKKARDAGYPGLRLCLELVDIINEHYADKISIRFLTPAVQLIRKGNGAVSGIIAKTDGGYARFNANKAVILATGGFDTNPEMMEAFVRPEDYATSGWWNPGWGTTGDGHMMGMQIGANMDPAPLPVMNFRGGNPVGYYGPSTRPGAGVIYVNGDGKRFANERLAFQDLSNAINAQTKWGSNVWQVFDASMLGNTPEEIANKLNSYDVYKRKGWYKEANSVRDLAAAIGVNADNLEKTIADYNKYVEKGIDEEFGRTNSLQPLKGKTLYALKTTSCILATVGGLMIDGHCRVLDDDDNVIEGLYAGGNASGSFFSGNYPRQLPGTSAGRAITFGYVAAEHALKGK